jgi:hypothetical protein
MEQKKRIKILMAIFVILLLILFFCPKSGGVMEIKSIQPHHSEGKRCNCFGFFKFNSKADQSELICYGIPFNCRTVAVIE